MKFVVLPDAERYIDRLYQFLLGDGPLAAQNAMLAVDEGFARPAGR
ncbi:MAG: hypothetical protein GY798_22530 [Hyphomicrobiales bacterium]|nr:hypothetical protein [Hyphomicrobiales bacterium]